MQVTITKITNGYLVTTLSDDGNTTATKAILQNSVGKVNCGQIGRAVTASLGSVRAAVKRTRKPRAQKAVAAAG